MSINNNSRSTTGKVEEFESKCPEHGWVALVDEWGFTPVKPDDPGYCPKCGIILHPKEEE